MMSRNGSNEPLPAFAEAPVDALGAEGQDPSTLASLAIREHESVKEALKRLDKTAEKVLVVVDEDRRLLGTISDGDIRRHLLKGCGLEDSIGGVYHTRPIVLHQESATTEHARAEMLRHRVEMLPIVDSENRLVDFVSWSQAFSERKASVRALELPVVIMAGGRGTRLDPFTRVFPKPLIPLGEKPIIEVIIDEFRHYGVKKFYVTLNYKAEMIEAYFKSREQDYELIFVREESFLGTAGALRLLADRLDGPFILCNCDTLVKANFEDVVHFHRERKSWLTILSALRHYEIPYGVLRYGPGGEVIELVEKPECTFTINTGCYVLDARCLALIPEGRYDMPDLIRAVIEHNRRAVTYPVNESDYVDIGQWEEYRRTIKQLNLLP